MVKRDTVKSSLLWVADKIAGQYVQVILASLLIVAAWITGWLAEWVNIWWAVTLCASLVANISSQIIHHANIKWESVPAMSSRIRGLRDTHRKRSRAAVGETLSWFSTPP